MQMKGVVEYACRIWVTQMQGNFGMHLPQNTKSLFLAISLSVVCALASGTLCHYTALTKTNHTHWIEISVCAGQTGFSGNHGMNC